MAFFRYEKKFLKEISRIKDPAVFFGIARILKVPTMIDKDTPREFSDMLQDILDNVILPTEEEEAEEANMLMDSVKKDIALTAKKGKIQTA